MSSPLFTIDADARLLISMIDALAIVRLRSDADLLLVEFTGGASRALRLSELIEQDDLFIELRIEHRVGHGVDGWVARLWSADSGSSSTVSSIRATSFAAFVGLE